MKRVRLWKLIDSVKNYNIVEISNIQLVKIYEAKTKWIY